jgi:hypothetical protein
MDIVEGFSSDTMPIDAALASYYRTHNLPLDGGASDPWFRVHIGSVSIPLPNPPARRRAVMLHDINHVVTGYNTVFSQGEMAIAAFEVAASCGRYGIVWYLNLSMFALGLIAEPREVFAAFVRGRRSGSIYRDVPPSVTLSGMSVADVRTLLHIDAGGSAATWTDRLQFMLWAAIAVLVLVAPALLVGAVVWAAVYTLLR